MTAAPAIKGWCPTLLSPMQSGDGWLVRIKPTAATLSAGAARLVADAARRHGNGHIDLTSRANLQVRGLTPRSSESFAETILDAGLASADPSVEAVRNVIASPLGIDDPAAAFDSHAPAREIEAMLGAEPALSALPDKFGILVDGGGTLPLAGVSADIMVRADGSRLVVQLDGGTRASLCLPERLAETVGAIACAALHLARERREPPRRMRALITDVGEEAVFKAAGLSPITAPPLQASATPPAGFLAYSGGGKGAFGVGLPFGRIDAEILALLAALSEEFADGTLRTTPWRVLVLPGVAASRTQELNDKVAALGLIADPADARLRIFACVGAPSCQSATVDARGDASRIAGIFSATGNRTIHVSGCAKSCAHRGAAALTLVGRDGRYDLIRNGGAGDRPSLTGLSADDAIALLRAVRGARP
mgnify:CR=1 FL=1